MQETRPSRPLRRRLGFCLTFGVVASLVLILGAFPGRLAAQVATSTVSGTVTDPTGAVIVGARVQLILTLTGTTRTLKTDGSGDFTFANVPAGTYEIRITQSGFKTYDRKNMQLAVSETLSLHKIALQVGSTATQVTVTAEAARVQTTSSSQANLVSESQIANLPNKGRNYMDYLQLLPGVQTNAGSDAPGWASGNVVFNGGDAGAPLLMDNGIAEQDSGYAGGAPFINPSTDSIAEERVHTGVEDAQYGGRAGGTIDVVTKHGTSHFHGDLYWFNRNNFFNGNDYFRKQSSNPAIADHPAIYKYNDFGGTIGGPILLPGLKFNKTRQRAFFFFSLEALVHTNTGGVSSVTMPTPAERAGVFTNLTQDLVNPSGPAPTCSGTSPDITCQFPSSAISPGGQGLLNVLPEPTCLRAGDTATGLNSSLAGLPSCGASSQNAYNYQYVNSYPEPWHNDVLRTDFRLSNNELFYAVAGTNREEWKGYTGFLGGSGQWPQSLTNYLIRSRQLMGSLISTLSPTVVNEITLGTNYSIQSDFATNQQQLTQNNRAALGLGPTVLPVLFPDSSNGGRQSLHVNPYDLIPNVSFGGYTNESPAAGGSAATNGQIQNSPGYGFESRYPFFGTDWDWTFTDDLSWVRGNHNLKFGVFYEHVSRSTATYSNEGGSNFNGVVNFNSNNIFSSTNASGSPFDTGNTFANALVGAFNSYSEDNTRWVSHGLNHDLEWYGQDNWRVTSRLTLDIGMRFSLLVPDRLRGGQLTSEFEPYLYNQAAQPGMIMPCIATSGPNTGLRVGCESTGAYVPPSAIGLYDPTTYGGLIPPYSGMMQTDGTVFQVPHIGLGPRFGFAWDIFGNGNTALRAGFGIFYDRTNGVDDVLTKADQPPLILSPAVLNSTIPQMLANPTQQTFLGPQNVAGPQRKFSQPQDYDTHMDIQQNLGHGMLLDVGYVGILSRHGSDTYAFNALPYGEHFQAAYQDPTKPAGTPYVDNIIRCLDPVLYCGYSNVSYEVFDGNSNYNALEVSVNKRFGSNFIGGGSYTFSKVLDYSCGFGGCPSTALPYLPGGRHYYYGVGGNNRTNNLKFNWHYNLPKAPFQNAFAKEAFNGWSLEGIATFQSGAPQSLFVSYFGDASGGGGPTGAIISGSLHPGVRTTSSGAVYYLNPSAISAAPHGPGVCQLNDPALCGLGNSSPREVYVGPGLNNWNISLLKKFPLGANESRYVQFRWETFNTFNHTQFSNPSSFTLLGGSGGPVNASSFGQITGTAVPPRYMEFALKLYF